MPRALGPATGAALSSGWHKLPLDVLSNICTRVSQNEVVALSLVDRATRSAVKSLGYPNVLRLSLPLAPALFLRCWSAPGAFSRLPLPKRKRLLCLLATSGSLANLRFAAERCGLDRPLTHGDVLCAAAEAGHVALCRELVSQRDTAQVGGQGGWGDAAVAEALAAGGLFPLLKEWAEANSLHDSGVSQSRLLVAAASSGHLYQFAWLVRRLGLRRRGLLEAAGGSEGAAAVAVGLTNRPPTGGLLLLRNVLVAAAEAGHVAFVEALLPPCGAAASLLYPLEEGRRVDEVWQRQWQQPAAAWIPELLPELILVDPYEDEARQAAAAAAAAAVAGMLRAARGAAAAAATAAAAAAADAPAAAMVGDGGGVVSPTELLLGPVVTRDVLAAAAKGCDLKGLQRLHAVLGRRVSGSSPVLSRVDLLGRGEEDTAAAAAETREAAAAAVLAGAVGSPTPDWREKFEWLERAGHAPASGQAGRSVRQAVVQAAAGLQLQQRRRGSQHGPACRCEGCGLRRRPEERPSGSKTSSSSVAAAAAAAAAAAGPAPRLESDEEALRRVMWLESRAYRAAPEPRKGDEGAKGRSGSSSAGCLAVNQAALAGNLPVLAFFMGPPQSRARGADDDARRQQSGPELAAPGPQKPEEAAGAPAVLEPPRPPTPVPASCGEIVPVDEAEAHPLAPTEAKQPQQPQKPQQPCREQQVQPRPQRRRRLLPTGEEQLLRALASGGQLASLRWLHAWAMARGRGCRLHEALSPGPLSRSLFAAAVASEQAETAHWVLSVLLFGRPDTPLRPYHPADPDSAATGITAAAVPPALAQAALLAGGGAGGGVRSRRASSTVSLSASLSASFHHLSLSAATDALHRVSAGASSTSSTQRDLPLGASAEGGAKAAAAGTAAAAPAAEGSKPLSEQMQEDEHRFVRAAAYMAANTEGAGGGGGGANARLDRALSLLRRLQTEGGSLFGEELMRLAVMGGSVPLARLMREAAAGFPWDEEDVWTAAARCGSSDMLLWLLEAGCKMEKSSQPLLAAAANADTATLQRLRTAPLSYPTDWRMVGGALTDLHNDDTHLQLRLVAEAEAAGPEAEAALQHGLAHGLFGDWDYSRGGCGRRLWRGLKRVLCCGGGGRRRPTRRRVLRKCLSCMEMSALVCLVVSCYPCIAVQRRLDD